jgi:hypothetical protein
MLIEEKNESKTEVVRVTWKFKDSDQEYQTFWNVCRSPFCGCSEMTFGIGRDPAASSPEASFEYDIVTKKVLRTDVYDKDKALSKRLVSEFCENDYETLGKIFRFEKIRYTDECNVEQEEPPYFPVEDIEKNSLMTAFSDIFPWGRQYFFTIDNTEYLVSDQYCLNSLCSCKNIMIDFMGFRDKVQFNSNDPTAVNFDLQTGKWEVWQESKNSHLCGALMRELKDKYSDIFEVFRSRRKILKSLYGKYREEYKGSLRNDERPITIGRNEPCPCGSGKKYKKCCGK